MAKGFRTAIFVLLFTGLTMGLSAQITISGGIALSSVKDIEISGNYKPPIDSSVGFGGNVYLDYLLPISVPLSLGIEVGFDGGSFTVKDGSYNYSTGQWSDTKDTIMAIPILLRGAYHFDLFPRLDLYLVGKVGFALGIWTGDQRDIIDDMNGTVETIKGFAFGVDAGVAYYFTQTLGIFGEVGFDDYMLKTDVNISGSISTFEAPFNRFITLGISTKF
jgi:hypothetical protein